MKNVKEKLTKKREGGPQRERDELFEALHGKSPNEVLEANRPGKRVLSCQGDYPDDKEKFAGGFLGVVAIVAVCAGIIYLAVTVVQLVTVAQCTWNG